MSKLYHELNTEEQRDYWKERWKREKALADRFFRERNEAGARNATLAHENEGLKKQIDAMTTKVLETGPPEYSHAAMENTDLKLRLAECRKTIEYLQK